MRRDLEFVARLLPIPTIALLAIVAFVPGRLLLAVHAYALVVTTVALGLGLIALRRAYPPVRRLRPVTRGPRRRRPPSPLTRIENEVVLGIAGSFELHYRLVPRLRSITAGLLATRRRVDLEADQEMARLTLGDETWELVRPDRPLPADRQARGIRPEALTRVVDSLEAI